jgi:uncharacterized membrane protein
MHRLPFVSFAAALLLTVILIAPADAGLRFCNETDARASVAIGYKGDGGEWTSEGWWRIEPGACTSVIGGDLKRRAYYWRATSKAYSWSMRRFMFCTSPKAFTIVGDDECDARGYDRNGFNEIKLAEGVTAFTFTLNPPSGAGEMAAAAPKRAAPEAPAGDPPGTHGEPYTITGYLGGCEGTDTAVECDLYSGGFRYRASTSGPTPQATIERLMDMPVNTPMAWAGDMISYYGPVAEVTIREMSEEGVDPFAGVRGRLQGYWISTEDSAYQLLLAGSLFEEYYDSNPTGTAVVEIAASCEGSKGDGPYLVAHSYDEDEDPRCFEIVEATEDTLTLFPLGTMRFLEFRKAG